jgi:hypothetical protein
MLSGFKIGACKLPADKNNKCKAIEKNTAAPKNKEDGIFFGGASKQGKIGRVI